MYIVRAIRNRVLAPQIAERAALYARYTTREERLAVQLERWNAVWLGVQEEVPYYRDLRALGRVPRQFGSWEEFCDRMPVTTKDDIRRELKIRTSERRGGEFYRTSGGSTSEPISIPAWKSELKWATPDIWLGRSWYGIGPASRLCRFWGHGHLLGTGFRGWKNAWNRRIRNRLSGQCFFSVYGLDEERMRRAAHEMRRFRPDYVIGYATALDFLVRVAKKDGIPLHDLGVKAVFGTTERYPMPDSESLLREVFGCASGMEYGAVETGVIAYTRPESVPSSSDAGSSTGGYQVFHLSFFLEVSAESAGGSPVFSGPEYATSLYPRAFPLVRYNTTDELVTASQPVPVSGVHDFREVLGRVTDYIELSEGARIHSVGFAHTMNHCRKIQQVQVIQEGERIRINYLASEDLTPEEVALIRSKLRLLDSRLEHLPFGRVDSLEKTIAGKTPSYIRRSSTG